MQDAAVKTSVDVRLNQDDVVELLLEGQKETKENELIALEEKLPVFREAYDKIVLELEDLMIESNGVRKTKEYKKFMQGVKALDLKVEKVAKVTYELEEVGVVLKFPLENFEGYKNPMVMLKRAMSNFKSDPQSMNYSLKPKENKHTVGIPTGISVIMRAVSADGMIVLTATGKSITSLKLNAQTKNLIKSMRKIADQWFKTDCEIHEIETTLFGLENDTKRSKSKFIKGMLGSSDSGKALVELMGNIQGQSLVEIGTK